MEPSAQPKPAEQLIALVMIIALLAAVIAGCSVVWNFVFGDDGPSSDATTSEQVAAPAPPRSSKTEPDPVTGAPIPAAGTAAREDMEAKETACFDAGRTDCADDPGAYLADPSDYP